MVGRRSVAEQEQPYKVKIVESTAPDINPESPADIGVYGILHQISQTDLDRIKEKVESDPTMQFVKMDIDVLEKEDEMGFWDRPTHKVSTEKAWVAIGIPEPGDENYRGLPLVKGDSNLEDRLNNGLVCGYSLGMPETYREGVLRKYVPRPGGGGYLDLARNNVIDPNWSYWGI